MTLDVTRSGRIVEVVVVAGLFAAILWLFVLGVAVVKWMFGYSFDTPTLGVALLAWVVSIPLVLLVERSNRREIKGPSARPEAVASTARGQDEWTSKANSILEQAYRAPRGIHRTWREIHAEARRRERKEWRTFAPGSFSVSLSGLRESHDATSVAMFLGGIPVLRNRPVQEINDLVERVVHISPQVVAEGISQADAVRLKVALEQRGGGCVG